MHQTIPYYKFSESFMMKMPKGIFLTVKNEKKVNTMTIGWGHIGFIWGKPTFVAYVRKTRCTYSLLEKANEFTVSVPLNHDLSDELTYCGLKSGRDVDKIKDCHLTLVDGRKLKTPIIGECDLHYECKVVCKQALLENHLDKELKNKYYDENDYHIMYFGEIVDSYLYNKE